MVIRKGLNPDMILLLFTRWIVFPFLASSRNTKKGVGAGPAAFLAMGSCSTTAPKGGSKYSPRRLPAPAGFQAQPHSQVLRPLLQALTHCVCRPRLVTLPNVAYGYNSACWSAQCNGPESTYLVTFAYKNVKFVLKHRVAQKRKDAVSKEVTWKLSKADNRKMSQKKRDERNTKKGKHERVYI